MHPQRKFEPKKRIANRMRAQANSAAPSMDTDKQKVMAYLRQLVTKDHASWHTRQNGSVWFRFNTGEIYLLEEAHITRIA
jgi:hypothetical protein